MKTWKLFSYTILGAAILTLAIGLIGPFIEVNLLPDEGASWYYWKLPTKETIPRLTAWTFYIFHQVAVWYLIYKSMAEKKPAIKTFLWVNTAFIGLHILQSYIWYDGLAQDVPVMSSQGSVIIMLVLVIIMDIRRRGLFFGKFKNLADLSLFKSGINFIRSYHGYFIAWAIVYTFWYHPTIASSGHLFGFFYIFLLFIQMSFIYTPIHSNKYFRFLLEVTVLFHGTAVAIMQQNNMWPMFLFGFATLLVVTQIYGIGLKKIYIRLIQLVYILGVILVFGGFTGHRQLSDIHQVLWIPIVEYALVFILLFVSIPLSKLKLKKSD